MGYTAEMHILEVKGNYTAKFVTKIFTNKELQTLPNVTI
jgi:hypothetical protein